MRGGKRAGAGRKTGSITKRTQEIVAKAAEQGISPLEVMLDNMRFAHTHAAGLIAKVMGDPECSPTVDDLKDILKFRSMAQACASDAAPYIHPKLAAIEHSGDPDNPIQHAGVIEIVIKDPAAEG